MFNNADCKQPDRAIGPKPSRVYGAIPVPGFNQRDHYLQCCPFWLNGNEAISEVMIGYNWFEKGQFATRFPNAPLIMLQSVEIMAAGCNRAEVDRLKEQRAKAKIKP